MEPPNRNMERHENTESVYAFNNLIIIWGAGQTQMQYKCLFLKKAQELQDFKIHSIKIKVLQFLDIC